MSQSESVLIVDDDATTPALHTQELLSDFTVAMTEGAESPLAASTYRVLVPLAPWEGCGLHQLHCRFWQKADEV